MPLLLALSALSTLSTPTSAAECFYPSGSQSCLDSGAVWDMRQRYCTNEWNTVNGRVGLDSSAHVGQILRFGSFTSQQECWDILADILNTCYGIKDGGYWSLPRLEVEFNYCLDISDVLDQ
jgi:hypothetical protein